MPNKPQPDHAISAPSSIPAAGTHGGDSWSIASALGVSASEIIDLSASMNPFAPNVGELIASIANNRPEVLGRYPNSHDATRVLADAFGEDSARVVLTNGGAEAIALVAAIEGRGEVIAPEFSLYERHLQHVETGAPRWRSNPSNPIGLLAAPNEKARVWDEAFYSIAAGQWTRGDRSSWRLGSLTKLWSCPGLRLGYLIAPDEVAAQQIRDLQPRWAVNAFALAALPELIEATDLDAWTASIGRLRKEFVKHLRELGFVVEETDCNWVLVRRPGLREALAPHLVLVRDCASFGLDGIARVALPHPDQLDHVIDVFGRITP